jgi:hypothetical protein
MPRSSNRCFQREMVGAVVCNDAMIWLDSATQNQMTRAESAAGSVRDCAHLINSFAVHP